MKADLLTEGITFDIDQDAEITAALLERAAGEFLRAGGVLLLGDWARLSEESRAAFVAANSRHQVDAMSEALQRAVAP